MSFRSVILRRFSSLSNALLVVIVFAGFAFGQATGGAVTGTVLDQAGAAIPNATVTIVNQQTGLKLTTQSSGAGAYSFPNVPVGDYQLSTEAAGFTVASVTVRVTLNQTATADIALQPGGVQASVQVNGTVPLVQSDTSQLGQTFESRQVTELPIFGNQNQLAVLAPNVVERSAGVLGSGGAVGGSRPRGNVFTVDGVDNNDSQVTGPINSVIQDSIQEFTLLSNNYNAEFGGTGGQFNTVTKSGTNRFAGSLFYYAQRTGFNAPTSQTIDALHDGGIAKKPRYVDDRYGFTFGGPVIKNKLFFYTASERRQTISAGSTYSFVAPTAEGLDRIAALPGASPFVVDLLKRFTQQAAAASFLQPVLGAASLDCAETPGSPNCIPFGQASVTAPNNLLNNQYLINIDFLPDDKDQFRFRYNDQRTGAEQVGGSQGGALPIFNNLLDFKSKLFSATWVRTISSQFVNELRLSFRDHNQDFPLKVPQFTDLPTFVDAQTGIDFGPGGALPQGTPVDQSYQVSDALNYVRDSHTFKFGGEFRDLIVRNLFLPRLRGDYIYSSFDELVSDSLPTFSALRGVGSPEFVGNQRFFSAFAQDDWKVKPNLTLNLGLRYEYETLPRSSRLQELNSPASIPGVIEFRAPRTSKRNFAPRLGFAYSPQLADRVGRFLFGDQGESSVRANFAVSYYSNFQNLSLLALPPQIQSELNPVSAGTDPNLPFLENGGLPGVLPPVTDAATARRLTQAHIPDQLSPYSISFGVNYQREITPSTAIEFRYLHSSGHRLPIQVRLNAGVVPSNIGLPTFLNAPTAGELAALTKTLGDIDAQRRTNLGEFGFAGGVTEFSLVGRSRYDAGSVSLTRRFAKSLGFTAAYTFSKTTDDSTNELNSSAINPRRPQNSFDLRGERGLSALDIPHRFVASVVYDVPFFDRTKNPWTRAFLGGWQVNGIFQVQSGQPFTPLSGLDSNRDGDAAGDRTILNPIGIVGTGSSVQALDAGGNVVPLGSPETVAYLASDPTAQYIQAGPGAVATAGRNTLRSKGFARTDASLLKNFRFREAMNLQFGAEIFDLFNQKPRTVGVYSPVGLAIGAAGLQTNTSFANVNSPNFNDYTLGDFFGRSATLRLKFIF
jgi:hypothetical protein